MRRQPRAAAPPRALLGDARFRRLWAAGALVALMRWLDILVLAVFTFDLTDSEGHVAIILIVRMLPRLLFGVAVGTVADRSNRKVLLAGGLVLLSAASAATGALIMTGVIAYWQLIVIVFISGIFWSTEFPVRRAMLADVVSPALIGRAMGFEFTTDSLTRMVGPVVGGALIVTLGAESAYFLAAGVFLLASAVAWTVPYTAPPAPAAAQHVWRDLVAGLRFVQGSSLLVGAMVVTVLFNLVYFPYQGMLPAIGEDVLGVDALGIGVLSALEAFGATLGSLWVANRAVSREYTRIYFYGTAFFCVCLLAFSQSESYALSGALLFVAGFGFAGFATMQTAVIIAATAPAMRGRVLGALSLSIGAGPLGGLQVGPLASALGAPATLAIMVGEALVGMLAVALLWPSVRRAGSLADPPAGAATPPPDLALAADVPPPGP